MGNTRSQVSQIYYTRMQALLNKINKDKQDQIDRDVAANQKRDKTYGDISAGLTIANLTKDLYEWRQGQLLKVEFDKAKTTEFGEVKQLKYKLKEDRPLKEVFTPKGALESLKRLTPKGGLQETKEFKEFKAKEELDKLLEEIGESADETFEEKSLIGWINPETGKQGTAAEYDKLTASRQLEVVEEVPLTAIPAITDEEAPALAPGLEIMSPSQKEANDMLVRSGVILPEGMPQEMKNKILDSLDTVVEEGDAQDYKAFVDTLKSGVQNPDTWQSVVTDLTENTDETIQSAIDGTYVPEVEDVSTVIETTGLGEIEEWEEGMTTPVDVDIPEGTLGRTLPQQPPLPGAPVIDDPYWGIDPGTKDILQWEKDLGVGEPGVFTEEELKNMPASARPTLPVMRPTADVEPIEPLILDERILDPDYPLTNREIAQSLGLQSTADISKEDMEDATKMFPGLSSEEALKQYYSYGDVEGIVSTGAETIEDIAALEGTPTVSATDIVPEVADIEIPDAAPVAEAPIVPDVEATTDVPDAKEPGLGGKALQGAQTVKQFLDIGNVLTDKEATGEEKGVAGLQATKILSEIALKNAKKKGTKALAKGVSTAAGGILGVHTAVTEFEEAGEAWEEKDYDEAILHGIGSASGGLQAAGAGMMLSGIGAPLGAVLYGVGTTASVISSVGLMFEGLFGGADAPAEAQKPKFNVSRYFDTIRQRRSQY